MTRRADVQALRDAALVCWVESQDPQVPILRRAWAKVTWQWLSARARDLEQRQP